MKKLGKFLVAGALAAVACVGLVACGGSNSADYKGEYKYENTYSAGSYYGVKVTVTISDVKGNIKGKDSTGKDKTYSLVTDGKITKVTVEADTDTMHNITPSWKPKEGSTDLGYEAAAAGLNDYLKKFEGRKLMLKQTKKENLKKVRRATCSGRALRKRLAEQSLQFKMQLKNGNYPLRKAR